VPKGFGGPPHVLNDDIGVPNVDGSMPNGAGAKFCLVIFPGAALERLGPAPGANGSSESSNKALLPR
jgi:hypothetical protein